MAKQWRSNYTLKVMVTLITLFLCQAVMAAAGKVLFVVGTVNITSNQQVRSVQQGAEINAQDTIETKSNGKLQIRFTDGSIVSLSPNTRFYVERYLFNGKNDGNETGFFSLFKGTFRTVSGLIGKGANKDAYKVSTPTATIGIRGTEYTATEDNGLTVQVHKGAVFVTNEVGGTLVEQGKQIYVPSPSKPAKLTNLAASVSTPTQTPISQSGLSNGSLQNTREVCVETVASGAGTLRSCSQF